MLVGDPRENDVWLSKDVRCTAVDYFRCQDSVSSNIGFGLELHRDCTKALWPNDLRDGSGDGSGLLNASGISGLEADEQSQLGSGSASERADRCLQYSY